MDYLLTRFDVANNVELDIWRITSPGYVMYHSTAFGSNDLVDDIKGKNISIMKIVRYIIAQSEDLEQLEGLAAIECLEPSIFLNAESLNR